MAFKIDTSDAVEQYLFQFEMDRKYLLKLAESVMIFDRPIIEDGSR